MKKLTSHLFVLTALIAPPMMVGCERTVSEETTVERRSDGTVVKEHEKTTVDHEGDRTTVEKKSVDRD